MGDEHGSDEHGIARRWLIVGGAVVIAIVVLLIVKLTNDSGASTARDSPTTDGSAATDRPLRARPRRNDAPVAPPGTVKETTVDGVLVRDHRTGDRPLPDLPVPRPPDRRKIAPQLVQNISAKLQIVMRECTSAIPADARGTKPKTEGVVVVEISAGELKVIEATAELRDVSGDTGAAAKACIEQKSVGQTVAAKGAEDVVRYPITLSFAIPAP